MRRAMVLAGIVLFAAVTVAVCYLAFFSGPPAKPGAPPESAYQPPSRGDPMPRPDSSSGNRMLLLPAEGQKKPEAKEEVSKRREKTASKPDGRSEGEQVRAEGKRPKRRVGGPVEFPTVGGGGSWQGSGGYPAAPGQRGAGERRVPLEPLEGGRAKPSIAEEAEGGRTPRLRRSLSKQGEGDDTPGPASNIKKYTKDGVGERQTSSGDVMPGWVTLDDGRKIFVIEVGGIKQGESGSEGKGSQTIGGAGGATAADAQKALRKAGH